MNRPNKCLLPALAFAVFFTACGSSGQIRPPSPHPHFGQGRTIELLQDEVQHYGFPVSITAPKGIYTAAFEDDAYVYYRGAKPIVQRFGVAPTRTPEGGLALSKQHLGAAFIYTMNRSGRPLVGNRRVRVAMVVKP